MILPKFDLFPNTNSIGRLVIFFLIMFIIMNIVVTHAFEISGYPVSFSESQLSFSGEQIKSHFSKMSDNQITLYFYAQLVDYAYIFVYSCLIFFLGIYIGRKFPEKSLFKKSGFIISLAGIFAGLCDGIENGFIVLMISNPSSFPNVYAIIHSCFALIKFILLGLSIIWIVLLIIIIMIRKLVLKKKH